MPLIFDPQMDQNRPSLLQTGRVFTVAPFNAARNAFQPETARRRFRVDMSSRMAKPCWPPIRTRRVQWMENDEL